MDDINHQQNIIINKLADFLYNVDEFDNYPQDSLEHMIETFLKLNSSNSTFYDNIVNHDSDAEPDDNHQLKLLYKILWRPWDECPRCDKCDMVRDVSDYYADVAKSRAQLLIDINRGLIDLDDRSYIQDLLGEAWRVQIELEGILEDENEVTEDSIDEQRLIECCRLKVRLEDIQIELNRLEDPYLRMFAKRDLIPSLVV